jgi:hypothetical protein
MSKKDFLVMPVDADETRPPLPSQPARLWMLVAWRKQTPGWCCVEPWQAWHTSMHRCGSSGSCRSSLIVQYTDSPSSVAVEHLAGTAPPPTLLVLSLCVCVCMHVCISICTRCAAVRRAQSTETLNLQTSFMTARDRSRLAILVWPSSARLAAALHRQMAALLWLHHPSCIQVGWLSPQGAHAATLGGGAAALAHWLL